MEGIASVYQANLVSRITGEGRAEFLRPWGHGFEGEVAEEGWGGGGNSTCACKLLILQVDESDGFGRNSPVSHVYLVRRTTSDEREEI